MTDQRQPLAEDVGTPWIVMPWWWRPSEPHSLEPGDWDWERLLELVTPCLMRIATGHYELTAREAADVIHLVYLRCLARDPYIKYPLGYICASFHGLCEGRSQVADA